MYSIKDVGIYAKLKNAIFCRYRTLSEIIGMLLVGDAVKKRMNVFIETSGRDTSMFDYVDFCFPKEEYNKLVVHFTINEIAYAQASVDKRMSFEMKKGKEALKEGGVERVLGLIQANSGSPFGSAHLPDIQKASSITHEAIFNQNSSLCSTKIEHKNKFKKFSKKLNFEMKQKKLTTKKGEKIYFGVLVLL